MLSSTTGAMRATAPTVLNVRPWPGVHLDARCGRRLGGPLQPRQFTRQARRIVGQRALAIGARVQLDDLRAQPGCGFDCLRVGLDEKRHPDAGVFQRLDKMAQMVLAAHHIEPALGGLLLALLRHQAAGVRYMAQGDGEHLVGGRHLQVEGPGQFALQPGDVGIRDVAPVLAQMRRNAVGARLDGQMRGTQGVGVPAAARVADGGDVIDVDAQAEVGRRRR